MIIKESKENPIVAKIIAKTLTNLSFAFTVPVNVNKTAIGIPYNRIKRNIELILSLFDSRGSTETSKLRTILLPIKEIDIQKIVLNNMLILIQSKLL